MAHGERPALDRILRQPRMRQAFRLLTEELSGSDLTSLLLEVFRRRAEKLNPADVLQRSRRDRFVFGSPIPFERLRVVENACISALPEDFRLASLSPLAPLGTHSVVAGVDQNNVVSTIRSTEVAADPTNGLALGAAWARKGMLARDPRSSERVRLAAFQRVLRAQRFTSAETSFAHFELFGLVTAGRDTGGRAFEMETPVEHLRAMVDALLGLGVPDVVLELTDFAEGSFALLVEDLRAVFAPDPVEIIDRPNRASGRRYYEGFCFKVYAMIDERPIEVADGGFVDWTRKLVGSDKERLLISGMGLDRLAIGMPLPTIDDEQR